MCQRKRYVKGLARSFIVATISGEETNMYVKMIAVSTILLAGCGGSAFSLGTEFVDDAGEAGDVVARVDADDAGTQVVTTDADAGKTPDAAPKVDAGQVEAQAEAAPQADAAPEDAAAEAASPPCLSTLSGVGTKDFHISFTMTSASTQGLVPLVNQKAGCNRACMVASACGRVFGWQSLVQHVRHNRNRIVCHRGTVRVHKYSSR